MNPFSETLLNNVSMRRGTVSTCTPKRDLNKYDKLKNSKLSTVHSSKINENCKKLVGDTRSIQPITKVFKRTQTPVKKDDVKYTDTFKNCIKISADQITPNRPKSRKLIFDVDSPSALLRQRLSFADVELVEEKEEESNKNLSPCVPYNKLLKGIHVYVEIRDGVDNRSAAIRAVLCSMGATVHDNLNKKVTHVIFREGLTKTYNKAIKLKAHLLSILWVEAVRNAGHLVPESLYPASGLEAYSSPITSKKFQRIKSMQPDYDNTREKELERKVRKSFRLSMSRPVNLVTNFITSENQDQVKKLMSPVCDNYKENGFESKVEELFHQTSISDRKNKLLTNVILSEKPVKRQKSHVKHNEDIIRDNALTSQQKKQNNETSTLHSINKLTQMDSISNTKSFQRRKSIRLLNKNK